MRAEVAASMAPAADMSQAVAAADRYVYTLGRPVTLQRGETKQIPLMTAQNVRVVREYRFEGLVAPHPGQEALGPVNEALLLELADDADLAVGGCTERREGTGGGRRGRLWWWRVVYRK